MAATMHFSFREHWRELRRGRPGRRFQDRYEQARNSEQECGPGRRIVLIGAAVLALLVAGVLSVFPGPAIPFFFLAGGLLATESRVIARFMDWSEVKLRKVLAWTKRGWRRLSGPGRVGVVALVVVSGAVVVFLGYRVAFR